MIDALFFFLVDLLFSGDLDGTKGLLFSNYDCVSDLDFNFADIR